MIHDPRRHAEPASTGSTQPEITAPEPLVDTSEVTGVPDETSASVEADKAANTSQVDAGTSEVDVEDVRDETLSRLTNRVPGF